MLYYTGHGEMPTGITGVSQMGQLGLRRYSSGCLRGVTIPPSAVMLVTVEHGLITVLRKV